MIENIRRYTGLIIVVIVLIFIGFLFLDASAYRMGGSQTVLRIDGRSYDNREVQRLGSNGLEVTQMLAQTGDFDFFTFRIALAGDLMNTNLEPEQFFAGRILLRRAAEEFGIHPSQEEISSFLRTRRAFTGPDGDFNEEAYRNFITRGIGRMGMTEDDIRALARDMLIFRTLGKIVGSGMVSNREVETLNLALENQTIDTALVKLDLAPFEAALDPTEDELRGFFETLPGLFRTEPRRKFSYVLATPALPEMEEELPEPAETLADVTASDEAREATRLERERLRAEHAAKYAEEKRRLELELTGLVDDFLYELERAGGAGFEALAEQFGWELKSTELFPASAPPEDLALPLRTSGAAGTAVRDLFRIELTPDPVSRLSDAIPVSTNQWLVARLQEVEDARDKTFEEARDEVRERYIQENAARALREEAESRAAAIREAMEEGTDFEAAALAAGFESVHRVEDVSQYHSPDSDLEPASLFQAARTVEPGSLAEPVFEPDRAFLIFVESREVVRMENLAAQVDSALNTRAETFRTTALFSWFEERMAAANIERPGR